MSAAQSQIGASRAAELGAIITVGAPDTAPASARAYTHPAIEGRTVVRLVPDALGEVEDISLSILGFAPQGATPVGRTRIRAIGFPAWPIIHDPKNARHALNLVGDLRRAAKTAKSKPGNAKVQIDEAAKMLGDSAPHFLPTFLEEAARIFLRLDNRTYAAQYFSKAREAERVHNLPIDEDRNSRAFLEFTLAGAITAKELTHESKALLERYDPDRALDIFLTLNVDRVKGGMPPYGGLAADLKRLAKAAHADPVKVQVRFLRPVLSSPSLSKAPAAFWKGFNKAIPALAAQEPTTVKTLLALTPDTVPSDDWIDVLASIGSTEDLVAARVDARAWVERYTRMLQSTWNLGYPRKLSLLVRRMTSLKGRTITLSKRIHGLQPELLDAILSTGAKVEFDPSPSPYSYYNRLSLSDWAEAEDRPDLDALAGSEHAHLAIAAIGKTASDHIDVLLAHSGTRMMLGRWAESGLGEHPTSQQVLAEIRRLTPLLTPAGLDAYPQQISALARRLDAAEILADVLRDGFLTEYTWPELEAAAAELGRNTTFHESFPAIGVAADGRVIWVDGDKRIAEASFTPAGADEPEKWHYLLAGNATACAYRKRSWEYFLTWSTDPGASTPIRYYNGLDIPLTLPFADGRLVGKRVVYGGDVGDPFADRALILHEGEHYWRLDDAFREFDPETGRTGRESLPSPLAELIEPYLRDGWELQKHTIVWCPAFATTARSGLSTAHGRHTWVRLRKDDETIHIDADGRTVRTTRHWEDFHGRMARPGGGHWLVDDGDLVREDDLAPMFAAADSHGRTHLLHRVPLAGWHQFRVRDEAASNRLRHATPDEVKALLEAVPATDDAVDTRGTDPRKIVTARARAAAAQFLGSDCPALVDSVVWATARVKRIVEDGLARTTREAQSSRTFPNWDASCEALDWTSGRWSLTTERDAVRALARRLSGAGVSAASVGRAFTHLLTRPVALLFSAARPLATEEFVGRAASAFGDIVDAGLYSPSCCVFDVTGIDAAPSRTEPARLVDTPSGPAVMIGSSSTTWSHRDTKVRFYSPSGAVPKSVDGLTPVVVARGCGIEAEALIDAFRILFDEGAPQWDPAKVDRLVEGTGWTRAAASLFLAGLPGIRSTETNFLDKDLRALMGLKVAEAREGREFLAGLGVDELLRLIEVGAHDPLRLVREGIDVEAVIAAWSGNDQAFHLPGDLLAAADSAFPWGGAQRMRELGQGPRNVDLDAWLWAASRADAGSPFALWLAQVLEQMKSACRSVEVEWQDYGTGLRTVLGLPAVDEDAPAEQVDSLGAWSMTNSPHARVAYDPKKSKDLTADRRLLDALDEGEHSLQMIRKRLDTATGAYDEIADALVHGAPGCAADPLVSAPRVVSAAAAALNVPEDSARYWLQLLVLAFPSDKNVESWNSWSKKRRLEAAAPLLEAGLLVEAKRARAGRSLFLPGGWQEATAPHKPMEVWKAPFYDLADAPKVSPRHDVVVPLASYGRLFEDAWQRYSDGDVPGYTELRTTRYRRR